MSRLRSLGIALEDNEEDQLPKEDGQEAVTGELISDESAVSQDAGEVGAMVTSLEEAGEDLEDLEKVQDVAEGTLEEGDREGMDPVTAQMTDIAVEAIRERLGLRGTYNRVSLEAFGSKSSRVSATNIAIEGISETFKKAMAAVLAGIQAIIKRILDFFKRIFSFNKKLLPAIDSLIKKAEALQKEGKKASETKIEDTALASSFANPALDDLLQTHLEFSEAVVKLNTGLKMLPAQLAGTLLGGTVLDKSMENQLKLVSKVVIEYFKPLAPVFPHKNNGGVDSDPFFDGSVATATMPKDSLAFPKIEFNAPQKAGSSASSLDVLTPGEQITLLKKLKKVIEASEDIVKMDSEVQKFGEGIAKATEQAEAKAGKVSLADHVVVKEITMLYRSSTAMFASVNLHIPAKNAAFGKALCHYVQASQKLYA